LQYIFFDAAVYVFRCCTTYFYDVSIYILILHYIVFFHMFTTLNLKCFVLFLGQGRGGEQRIGVRWTQFHSILFRSDYTRERERLLDATLALDIWTLGCLYCVLLLLQSMLHKCIVFNFHSSFLLNPISSSIRT
jgi:hypothetical protein